MEDYLYNKRAARTNAEKIAEYDALFLKFCKSYILWPLLPPVGISKTYLMNFLNLICFLLFLPIIEMRYQDTFGLCPLGSGHKRYPIRRNDLVTILHAFYPIPSIRRYFELNTIRGVD